MTIDKTSTTSSRSVALSSKQQAFLKKEAARIGITVSDLIRRIIDQHREINEMKIFKSKYSMTKPQRKILSLK
jgi:hypothetical protein